MKTYLRSNFWQLTLAVLIVVAYQAGLLSSEAAAATPAVLIGSTSITAAFVQQWDNTIRLHAQQQESRLMKCVTDRGQITGDGFTVNNLDKIELDENTVRHGDTEWGDVNHTNRLATMKDFYKALPLDRNDIPKMLVNPVTGGDYMRLLMAAKNRKADDVIYDAARGTIYSKDGATAYALPSGQKIAHGSAGFTKAKLIQARKMFRAAECDAHSGEELYLAYNSAMLEDLLSDTTLTSADFMSVKMLQEGDVSGKWMSFNWVPYEAIDYIGSVYYTVAWAKSGIHFGKGYEEGNVTRRGDKKDLWQVSMGASYGAGRQADEKVVEIAFQ